jgi:three-Cys-motif partner protein
MEAGRRHEFGSVHTLIKLQTLAAYMAAYATALKNLRFRLHYIDSFAGTGTCWIKVRGERVEVAGSASIATECKPAFNRLVFIEEDPQKVQALERLKAAKSELDIAVVNDDVRALEPRIDRAIAFLDPYGMAVKWETLEHLARSRIVDVWYLFPLSAVCRQLARGASGIDADKASALTRIFGTDEWRTAFYGPARQANLFADPSPDERNVNVPEILAWWKRRLETIFPAVAEPKILYQVTESGKPRAPLFALYFAVSNPAPKAIALAMRIAKSLLKD